MFRLRITCGLRCPEDRDYIFRKPSVFSGGETPPLRQNRTFTYITGMNGLHMPPSEREVARAVSCKAASAVTEGVYVTNTHRQPHPLQDKEPPLPTPLYQPKARRAKEKYIKIYLAVIVVGRVENVENSFCPYFTGFL